MSFLPFVFSHLLLQFLFFPPFVFLCFGFFFVFVLTFDCVRSCFFFFDHKNDHNHNNKDGKFTRRQEFNNNNNNNGIGNDDNSRWDHVHTSDPEPAVS